MEFKNLPTTETTRRLESQPQKVYLTPGAFCATSDANASLRLGVQLQHKASKQNKSSVGYSSDSVTVTRTPPVLRASVPPPSCFAPDFSSRSDCAWAAALLHCTKRTCTAFLGHPQTRAGLVYIYYAIHITLCFKMEPRRLFFFGEQFHCPLHAEKTRLGPKAARPQGP